LPRAIPFASEGVERASHGGRVAEPAFGFRARGRRLHASRDQFLRPELEMVRQLFAHLLLDGNAPQPRAQCSSQHG
jgi:hypothetical protein